MLLNLFCDMVRRRKAAVTVVVSAVFAACLMVQFGYVRKRSVRPKMPGDSILRLPPLLEDRKFETAVQVTPSLNQSSINNGRGFRVPPFKNALPNPYLLGRPPNLTEYKDSIKAFIHNPKSGGTTLKDCLIQLSRKSGKRRKPLLITNPLRADMEAKFVNGVIKPEDYDIMAGGTTFGVCERITSRKCSYFTIVREPYDRMVSHYFFCKNGGETTVSCQNRTVEEYAVAASSILFNQLALRVACRCDKGNCQNLSQEPWTCRLDHAYSRLYRENGMDVPTVLAMNLEREFAVVGLTEEYETTLRILQHTFDLPFYDECRKLRRNSGTYGTTDERILDRKKDRARKTLMNSERVRAVLLPDVILYRKFKEIFNKQKEKLLLV